MPLQFSPDYQNLNPAILVAAGIQSLTLDIDSPQTEKLFFTHSTPQSKTVSVIFFPAKNYSRSEYSHRKNWEPSK